jgi:hypothetical protein
MLGHNGVCNSVFRFGLAAVIAAVVCSSTVGQTAAFTGVGQLSGGNYSKCFGVSPDGTIVVGEAKNSSGETVAVIYDLSSGSPSLTAIGFLDPVTNRESKGRGIAVDIDGGIHACGNSKNSSGSDRGFYWKGNRAGTGTFYEIVPLAGDSKTEANELWVSSPTLAQVVGTSGGNEAYLWPSNEVGTNDNGLGVLRSNSHGYDVCVRFGETQVVGWSDSTWSCGSTNREAFHWTANGSTMYHDKGLDWVCGEQFGGQYWQISAGPDEQADTSAGSYIQTAPVGTTGLVEPDAIVASSGGSNAGMNPGLNPSPDDIGWPVGHNCNDRSLSVHYGVSSNGRYRVGYSTYPEADCSPLDCADVPAGYPRQAHMRDVHNRDDSGNDHCGGIGFLWPLGFLPGDGTSEAYAVSNGGGPNKTDPRTGVVVVGQSRPLSFDPFGYSGPSKAFVCFIKDQTDPEWNGQNDLAFLRHQDAAPGDPGASAASQFKDMKDLKLWLQDENGIDMTGWELREARSVSDDGTVITGWGIHDGVEEGFVVTIEPPPATGACCITTGWGTGTCTPDVTQDECVNTLGGEYIGDFSVCGVDNGNCDFCPVDIFADADEDGDVDEDDFGAFQECLTGQAGGILPGCQCADWDNDGDVDSEDYGAFEACASGPDVLANIACDD